MDVTVDVTVPADRHRQLHRSRSSAADNGRVVRSARAATTQFTRRRWTTSPTTAATAPTRCVVRYFGRGGLRLQRHRDREPLPVRHQRRHRRDARRPTKLLTRAPNSFTHQHARARRHASTRARPSTRSATRSAASPVPTARSPARRRRRSSTAPTASPTFRFDKPGRYVIVARAKRDIFFTPWSARGQRQRDRAVRHRARDVPRRARPALQAARPDPRARRPRPGHDLDRPRPQGRQVPPHRHARRSTRRAASRSSSALRGTGVYRLRYTYRGSSLVAAGRVTEAIRIRTPDLLRVSALRTGRRRLGRRLDHPPPLHDPVAADQERGVGLVADARPALARARAARSARAWRPRTRPCRPPP